MDDNQKVLVSETKEKLSKVVEVMDRRLGTFWQNEINVGFGFGVKQKEIVKEMLLHARDHNLRPAKRIRSAFVYYGWLLGRSSVEETELEEVFKIAEGVELIHTGLLMQDDFMDKDLLRRGEETTHRYFAKGDTHHGDSMMICLSDTLFFLAMERMMESNLPEKELKRALSVLTRGIVNTTYGQALDVSMPKFEKTSEEEILSLYKTKTGIYTFETPILAGALLAGVSEEVLSCLKKYANYGGLAFQIYDDILGAFGETEKTGKSTDSDLLQGKVTLLVSYVLENGEEEEKKDLLKVWGKGEAKKVDLERAKEAIKNSGAYEYTLEKAKLMAEKAIEEVRKLKELNLNNEALDFLEGIVLYTVNREV